MPVIKSKVNPSSQSFKKNSDAMQLHIDKLYEELRKSLFQGDKKYIDRVKEEGGFLARERIEMLLDEDAPFLELLPLAGYGRNCFNLGGTLVGGIGKICNKLCLVLANVATIKGGSIDYVTLQKGMRINEIAMENRLPVIYLVESAGANLPEQAKIFNWGGANFREITRRSKARIPTISVVFGNCTAGGAYIPGMSDYVIMVKEKAKVFLAGPPLVKMATGELVDDESLGGAEMHSKVSGVSDFMAKNEIEAIAMARNILSELNTGHENTCGKNALVAEPLYSANEIPGIIPASPQIPYDVKEIIVRIIDGSEFTEFKPDYGNTLITGYAKICGYQIGIIANNGVLFSEAANKGAHFIQLCNKNNTPLLFLQNITGFMVGKKYEQEGIIKHGAKMVNAVSNSSVPAITIMTGSSYGAGNYAMCGRAFQPRFLFSWPNSRIAVMGSEQLTGVMSIIQQQSAVKSGVRIDKEKAALMQQKIAAEVENQSSAFYASGQLWDDGVIDPRETRYHLGMCLETIHNSDFQGSSEYGVFRM